MQKQVAFVVIGDEILSGRTRDINVQVLATRLGHIGARLAEVRMIPDEEDVIIETLNVLRLRYDYVFTSGGIGPTHDDITADCVAKAFGVSIDIRDDARQILSTNYANGESDLTPARLRMARIPDGAVLIDNPISKAPGFKTENVLTLAGVPAIFEAMLDHALTFVETGEISISKTITIRQAESSIATPLAMIARAFDDLSIGSYPQQDAQGYFADIVVRGFDGARIDAAIDEIKQAFS